LLSPNFIDEEFYRINIFFASTKLTVLLVSDQKLFFGKKGEKSETAEQVQVSLGAPSKSLLTNIPPIISHMAVSDWWQLLRQLETYRSIADCFSAAKTAPQSMQHLVVASWPSIFLFPLLFMAFSN